MANKFEKAVYAFASKDPVNLARAMEHFMLTNRDFLDKKCGDAFRLPYICVVFRDYPQVIGHRFADFLADPQLSDSEAADLQLKINAYASAWNIYSRIPENVFLRRIASCLNVNDPEHASFHRVVLNFHDVRSITTRTCDKAYASLSMRYPQGDFPHKYLYDENYITFEQRDPLIAAAKEFVAKKLARLDAVEAQEKNLREQAFLQLSPAEYDSLLDTWQTLGGGSAPDAVLTLTLDMLFAQTAMNASRTPTERDRAMTLHLAARAREFLQKDKVETKPLGENAIRDPESVWTWFRNHLAYRLYKQPDFLNEDRDLALQKFLKVYESRHDRGELFRLPGETAETDKSSAGKQLERADVVAALEKNLREQAVLQLSPAEYDSLLDTWRTLGGGGAPDAVLTLTLDTLFAQTARNAKRAPTDRDKAMTLHLAARARELLQKDKVDTKPLGEDAIRDPESVWMWFRNPLAHRLYKHPDRLDETRGLALQKFLKDYESRHDRGELFRLPGGMAEADKTPPQEPRDSYNAACAKLKNGEFAAAETLFAEAVIAKFPEHELAEAARCQIGQCRLGKGGDREIEAAEAYYREILPGLKTPAGQARCRFALGQLAFAYRLDWDAAEAEFAAGAKLADAAGNPTLAGDVWLYYGICQLWRKDYENAKKSFSTHLRYTPGITAWAAKTPSNVRYLLQMAYKKKYMMPFDDKVMAGGKDNRRVQAALFMAVWFKRAGNAPKTREWFSAVRDGKYGTPTVMQLAYAEKEIAECLKQDKKLDQAIAIWKKFETEYKDTVYAPKAMLDLAANLFNQYDEKDEAVRVWHLLADRYPENEYAAIALYNSGLAYYLHEEWQQAVNEYNRLIQRYPDSWCAKDVSENELKECKEKLGQ